MPSRNGGAHGRTRLTIRDLGKMVQTDYEMNGKKTARRVREAFAHLIPFFGDLPIHLIPQRTNEYIAHRLSQGAAPATIRLELMAFSRGQTIAVQTGHLTHRRSFITPRVRNVRLVAIPPDKLDALMAYLPSDERDVVQFAFLTGWRRGEILGLRWENVDLEERVIRLGPGTTKNGEPRVFPFDLFPALAHLIERRLRKSLEIEERFGGKVEHVFHRQGVPILRFTRSWARACARAGLREVCFHDLRRSASMNMVRAGCSIQVAMKLMGHKTRHVFDNYAFVEERDLRSGVAQYAAFLAGSLHRVGL